MKTYSSIIAGVALTAWKTTAIDNNKNNTMNNNETIVGRRLGCAPSRHVAELAEVNINEHFLTPSDIIQLEDILDDPGNLQALALGDNSGNTEASTVDEEATEGVEATEGEVEATGGEVEANEGN